MVVVGRHINGITINPLEYLLGEDGKTMEFPAEDAAKQFLRNNGFNDEDMYYLVFETIGVTQPKGVKTA